ncbi:MAG: hypothetical protein DPW16_08130 [Chloroflexi bacterium]|nr:hypothetical protein [Chloroflexota bacterium]
MLTADLIRPRLRIRGDALHVELLPPENRHWQATAAALIDLFQNLSGHTSREWEMAVEQLEGERLDYVVLRGLAKVLSDGATWVTHSTPLPPADLRRLVFGRGPVLDEADLFHPQSRAILLQDIAAELGTDMTTLEQSLFADLASESVLAEIGPTWTPESLITRYNLELTRGVLYWARLMEVEIYDGYQDFWRYLKLFKLMFEAKPYQDGYWVTLDGPISPFVSTTTRYGRQFAAFLPALLLGERWQMRATVKSPFGEDWLRYELNSTSPLTSHFKRSGEFDSRMEADFAAAFIEKFGEGRGQWQLSREDEVLLLGDTVMIPDFAFTHQKDGRRALLEIMGFWHPDYLRRKLAKVRTAGRSDLILLVYEGVNLTAEQLTDVPGEVLYFKNKPVLKDVMALVERVAK